MSFQTTDAEIADQISRQFISEKESRVSLVRHERVATSAGGWKLVNPQTLDPQSVRLIPGQMYADTVRTTADGREVNPTYTLVAPVDGDLQIYDTFSLDGFDYEIVWVEAKVLFGRIVGEVFRYAQ